MFELKFMAIIGVTVLAIAGWVWLKIRQAQRHAAELEKANQWLNAENDKLKVQKATIESQVKNYKVKQKNEESSHSLSRESVIDGLHANNDLRD